MNGPVDGSVETQFHMLYACHCTVGVGAPKYPGSNSRMTAKKTKVYPMTSPNLFGWSDLKMLGFARSRKSDRDSANNEEDGKDIGPRGLMVRDPFASQILNGEKVWEIRGRPKGNRGKRNRGGEKLREEAVRFPLFSPFLPFPSPPSSLLSSPLSSSSPLSPPAEIRALGVPPNAPLRPRLVPLRRLLR